MIFPLHRSLGVALRIVVAGACCVGIWNCWHFARADYLFHSDTEESVRSAIGLAPDGWAYYMRLAQFDREHTDDLLATSLRMNRYDAQADIELGLQYEKKGDFAAAERQLLNAYDVDRTYMPRWTLANYYFRRDNLPAFWAWARKAAQMPSDDVASLFELCWRASPDPGRISAEILNDKPELIRQYIGFLLAKNQAQAVSVIAPRLIDSGDAESDSPLLFAVVNRLVAAGDGASANTLWHLLIQRHWVVADATVPNNPGFARKPLPVGFDWSIPEYSGLRSLPGPQGLQLEFTGTQPEECTVAEQALALEPGKYRFSYSYRSSDIAPGTGLKWQILDPISNSVIEESSDLSSDEVKQAAFSFSVPPGASVLRLRLNYRRALGTPRITGTLMVLSTKIQATSQ